MNCLILEPKEFSLTAIKLLQQNGPVTQFWSDQDDMKSLLAPANVLFTRLAYRIDAAIIDQAPALKYVVSPTTGLNHLDLELLAARNIEVLSLQNEREFLQRIPATAEHTWMLILALHRNLVAAHQLYLAGKQNRDDLKGHELQGRNIGIIGLGRIGSQIASYAKCFGLKVLAYDQRIPPCCDSIEMCPTVEYLLEHSDIITVHLSLKEDTNNFLNAKRLAKARQGAYFINTARGELVDHSALLTLLEKRHIKAAALDVIPNETAVCNDIKRQLVDYAQANDNLLLTPHLGGATYESMEKTEVFMVNKLIKAIAQEVKLEVAQ